MECDFLFFAFFLPELYTWIDMVRRDVLRELKINVMEELERRDGPLIVTIMIQHLEGGCSIFPNLTS